MSECRTRTLVGGAVLLAVPSERALAGQRGKLVQPGDELGLRGGAVEIGDAASPHDSFEPAVLIGAARGAIAQVASGRTLGLPGRAAATGAGKPVVAHALHG